MSIIQEIKARHDLLVGELGEKQYRLYLAAEAKSVGWGGTSKVAEATGASRNTIAAGLKELEQKTREQQISEPAAEVKQGKKVRQRLRGGRQPVTPGKRLRKAGGGRKRESDVDVTLKSDLDKLLEPFEAGDPCSPLRWTCKSIAALTQELSRNIKAMKSIGCAALIVDRALSNDRPLSKRCTQGWRKYGNLSNGVA